MKVCMLFQLSALATVSGSRFTLLRVGDKEGKVERENMRRALFDESSQFALRELFSDFESSMSMSMSMSMQKYSPIPQLADEKSTLPDIISGDVPSHVPAEQQDDVEEEIATSSVGEIDIPSSDQGGFVVSSDSSKELESKENATPTASNANAKGSNINEKQKTAMIGVLSVAAVAVVAAAVARKLHKKAMAVKATENEMSTTGDESDSSPILQDVEI